MICSTLSCWRTCSNSHFTLCYFLIATFTYPGVYTQSSKGRSRLWGFTVLQYIRNMTAQNSTALNAENWLKRISTVETFRNKILSIPFLQRSLTAYPLYPYPWSLINPKPETINLIHHACKKLKPLSNSYFGSSEATKFTTNVWSYSSPIRWNITNEENFLKLLSNVCICHPDERNSNKAFTQNRLNFYRWEESLAHIWPTSISVKYSG